MAAIHSITAAPRNLIDAVDALDDLGEKIELLRLALTGALVGGHEISPKMIEPLIGLAGELASAREAVRAHLQA